MPKQRRAKWRVDVLWEMQNIVDPQIMLDDEKWSDMETIDAWHDDGQYDVDAIESPNPYHSDGERSNAWARINEEDPELALLLQDCAPRQGCTAECKSTSSSSAAAVVTWCTVHRIIHL